ncbi:MAG: NADH-quinone oxidoreductase subunit L [Proteobacteria bacterium]|nr:NADH-quinone oxidoreductase subunit L [Pseudomonadota bacterium]
MELPTFLPLAGALLPVVLMCSALLLSLAGSSSAELLWKRFGLLSWGALLCALATLAWPAFYPATGSSPQSAWLAVTTLGAWMAALVQLLGTVIAAFSSRYLQGERGQARYVAAFAGVLASVHLLLLANHWLVLIAAWAMIGAALRHLLCFYPDRPFALLAAHKKRLADRLADAVLLVAAALAWWEVGSGTFSDLWQHVAQMGATVPLQLSALCLVLAVILRTALFPAHGWLIQVMEAPTPVSALLHAGVVNLGGYVLIHFAPLLEAASAARWLLVAFGLATALLAGQVMLTRVSIKVRLAWSTVAQMGFMALECALGLYTLAALHLIGHSLYKAHTFLAASTVVQHSKLQMMRGHAAYSPASLMSAPVLAFACIALVQSVVMGESWPWWWSGLLALAWAPLLWLALPQAGTLRTAASGVIAGLAMVTGLAAAASLAHALPFGVHDAPDDLAGIVTLAGMAAMYLFLLTLQLRPQALAAWRRWSYAGFYVDEFYTRLALRLWPTRWTPATPAAHVPTMIGAVPQAATK